MPSLAEIQNYLTPAVGGDTTPPVVQVLTPNGGQTFVANRRHEHHAGPPPTPAASPRSISTFPSTTAATYQPIALGLANIRYLFLGAGQPSDGAGTDQGGWRRTPSRNSTNDTSDSVFTIVSPPFTNPHGVATTLRDFDLPGTQPFEQGADLEASSSCASCHGGYNAAVEPQFNWQGSMMAHASRDLLFQANMAIANQDAADSGRSLPALPLAARLAGGTLGADRRQPHAAGGRRRRFVRALPSHGGPGLHRGSESRRATWPSSRR